MLRVAARTAGYELSSTTGTAATRLSQFDRWALLRRSLAPDDDCTSTTVLTAADGKVPQATVLMVSQNVRDVQEPGVPLACFPYDWRRYRILRLQLAKVVR